MFTPSFLIQVFIGGILMGGIYSFIALGLTLIFGVMKVINFAHGALLMLGMYASFWLMTLFGIDPNLSVFITIPVFFGIGWLIQRFLIEPVLDAPHLVQIVVTLGLTMFLENIALFFWSPDYRSVQVSYQDANILIGDISIGFTRLISFILAIVGTGTLYLFLKRTTIGKAIRATADDKEAAILMGINQKKIYYIAFGIGAACVGMAGSFITPIFFVDPYIGGVFVLMAFVVVIMGGIGNFLGALVCGLIVGVTESFGAIFMPGSSKRVLPFALLILIMMFKPAGLFGRRS